ncbi:LysR family transcriptional regulator [Piscinibacter sakaiensis]|uniref:LysR family transcriptional regulator n=1 Tax=Piscinibacter sakaiensis TaxID=1547922 RepID=UPI00372CFF16
MRQTNEADGPVPPLQQVDLNLLRLFDAVFRTRSVGRAALALGLSQPAASQGLTRLRLQLRDALFATPRAERLAAAVQQALRLVEAALQEDEAFDPARAAMTLRLHLSDIGEARFLPELLAALHQRAPQARVHSRPVPHEQIAAALDGGLIDFAIGYLPSVDGTARLELLRDRYAVLVRRDHPLLRGRRLSDLRRLEVVAVRSHAETLRLVEQLGLVQRLVSAHFLALPSIVQHTDLGVVMPRAIAAGFAAQGGFAIVDHGLPPVGFTVSLHWSARFENDPAHRWMRQLLLDLFREPRG